MQIGTSAMFQFQVMSGDIQTKYVLMVDKLDFNALMQRRGAAVPVACLF